MSVAENISVLPTKQRKQVPFAPPVPSAKWRLRHKWVAGSFVLCVLVPLVISAWYLYTRAADQYASTVAFSVRSEEPGNGLEMLGGIAELSGSGANDSDVLYDYLISQQFVGEAEQAIGLSRLWSDPENDVIFGYNASGTIEDLLKHWRLMVDVSHDAARGIIEVRARAFSPEAAVAINNVVLQASTDLINQINGVAREDLVRYALEDLQRAKGQLATARQDLTRFRIENNIVDPMVDAAQKSSQIARLDEQLTQALIDVEMLSGNTRVGDTRLAQAEQRARVIRKRIAQERAGISSGANEVGRANMAQLFGEYERLVVDVEFAELRYRSSRASFDAALSETRRKTRYLAAHVHPTEPQKSMFPRRAVILSMIGGALILAWMSFVLIGFSFLDRR